MGIIKSMPSRNVLKQYVPDTYYHAYNRGVSKQVIYHDEEDYAVFLNLLKRYLDEQPHTDIKGREYEWLRGQVELLAFCLMPNHFHMLFYLQEPDAVTRLMQSVTGAYTIYYNKKYDRVGPLFQSRFKAARILNESYLMHISRYIHMNPDNYKSWSYSSLEDYLGNRHTGWLQHQRITEIFKEQRIDYRVFLSDYEDYKAVLEDVEAQLASQD